MAGGEVWEDKGELCPLCLENRARLVMMYCGVEAAASGAVGIIGVDDPKGHHSRVGWGEALSAAHARAASSATVVYCPVVRTPLFLALAFVAIPVGCESRRKPKLSIGARLK